ncbi:MAG: AraC family transcriptional regulator [Bacteroidia bacterium]
MTTLHIKNMVCDRCISVVTNELKSLGLNPDRVTLGEVDLNQPLSPEQKETVKETLQKNGFELLDDRKSITVEQIKTLLINLVHYNHNEKPDSMRYSEYLEKQVGMDYSNLSKIFSEAEGITIEHYLISQKVERIKELLMYDQLSVNEISMQMGYSSAAHLSSQFKKLTGTTPGKFRNLHHQNRKPLDKI